MGDLEGRRGEQGRRGGPTTDNPEAHFELVCVPEAHMLLLRHQHKTRERYCFHLPLIEEYWVVLDKFQQLHQNLTQ